jgi:hypothetical protein
VTAAKNTVKVRELEGGAQVGDGAVAADQEAASDQRADASQDHAA